MALPPPRTGLEEYSRQLNREEGIARCVSDFETVGVKELHESVSGVAHARARYMMTLTAGVGDGGVASSPKGYARQDRDVSVASRVTPSLDTTRAHVKCSRRTRPATPQAKNPSHVSQDATLEALRQQFSKRGFGFGTLLAYQVAMHGVDHGRETVLLGFHNAVGDAEEELARSGAFGVVWAGLQAKAQSLDASDSTRALEGLEAVCVHGSLANVAQYRLCLISEPTPLAQPWLTCDPPTTLDPPVLGREQLVGHGQAQRPDIRVALQLDILFE